MTSGVKPSVIGLVGMTGSGKSTVREAFEKNGFVNIYFGGIVVEEVKRRGLEVNEVNERFIREELRANEGMDVMASRSTPKIDTSLASGNKVVIDDLYSFSEYKLLRTKYSDAFMLIAIISSAQQRYDRLAVRPIRPLTRNEAISRDFAEIENIEKGGPIAIADYYILNDGNIENLQTQIDKLLALIL